MTEKRTMKCYVLGMTKPLLSETHINAVTFTEPITRWSLIITDEKKTNGFLFFLRELLATYTRKRGVTVFRYDSNEPFILQRIVPHSWLYGWPLLNSVDHKTKEI